MQKTSRWFFIQKKTRLRLTNSKPHLVTHSSKLRVARLLRVWSSVTIASCQGDPQPREPLGEDASTLLVPRLPTPLKYPNLLRFLVSQYRLFVRFVQWCQSKSEVSISSVYGWMRLILFPHGSHIAWSKISLHRGWRQFRVLNSAIFYPMMHKSETEDSLTSTFWNTQLVIL